MRYTDLGIGHLVQRVSEPKVSHEYGELEEEADNELSVHEEIGLKQIVDGQDYDETGDSEDESEKFAEGSDNESDRHVDEDESDIDDGGRYGDNDDDDELYDEDDDEGGYESQ